MSQKLFRILLIVMTGLFTLMVLVGGTYIYNKKFYAEPIEDTVTKMSSVDSFKIEKENSNLKIKIRFNIKEKLRTNFYSMLDQLEGNVDKNNSDIIIEINNIESDELGEFLKKSRFPIYQAIATGEFNKLPVSIASLAKEKSINYDIEIDNYFIFLTAHDNEKIAHMIIKRSETPLNILNTIGGEYL